MSWRFHQNVLVMKAPTSMNARTRRLVFEVPAVQGRFEGVEEIPDPVPCPLRLIGPIDRHKSVPGLRWCERHIATSSLSF
jgi:hypothetical protein